MKRLFYFLALLFVSCISYAQTLTSTENYVYSRTYLEAVTVESTTAKQVESVQYFDGLGRAKQTIGIKSSINGKDIVVANAYDLQGRQTKSYLPVPVNTQNGAYQTTIDSTSANTHYGISNAYSEVLLEKSPLGRVLKQANPGADWAISTNNTVKYEYSTNAANEVKRLRATTTWNTTTKINDVTINFAPNDSYTTSNFYNVNTLSKKIVKDEDDKETQIFTNSGGQTILLRKVNKTDAGASQYLDTYYVYDEFDNLVMVIPPKAATFSTIADLNNVKDKLCYQYKYDKYNRLAEKKLPGKKYWEYIIYDYQGRPILTQDSNQHLKEWSFVKYDRFSRIVYTGIFTLANTSRDALQMIVDGNNSMNNETRATTALVLNGQNIYYTNTTFPSSTASMQILQVHYYDDYPTGSVAQPTTILTKNTLSATATSITSNSITTSRSTKGMPTVSYIKNTDSNSWTGSFIWYDTLGRVIGTHSVNYLGGYTKTERSLDFTGATLEQYTYHKRISTSTEIKIKDRFTYNTKNILLQHYQQILNNGSGATIAEELLADYTYNDLGQVTNKKVGNNLQSIDYTYNIRGWLTSINDINNLGTDLFAYKIKYNQLDGLANPNNTYSSQTVKKNYNGNITEIDWRTAGTQSDGKIRRYGFVYDNVNRLRAGFYQDQYNASSKEYSEYLEYDLNGNITKLNRTGKVQTTYPEVMDDLTYNYAANDNVLTSLTESGAGNNISGYKLAAGTGATLAYDDNGNNTTNLDMGITNIAYNFLNLPTAITTNNSQNINYTYRADGTKLKKVVVATSKTTEYLDGFQYENGAVQFYPNEEGYYDFKNGKYIYNYKDHLGNVRITFTKNASNVAVVLEENNYYPFGLKHQGYNTGSTSNNSYAYKYNGKELQENGLLDYGWRNYLPELGRWNVIDQLAENYHSTSPYAYVLNNPVMMIDPDGRLTQAFINEILNSPSGTTWMNSENGYFYNNWGGRMNYDGQAQNYLAYGMDGGGGFDAGSYINVPEVVLSGKKSMWGLQMQSHFNSYMDNWNAQQNFWAAQSRLNDAIANTKVGQSVSSFENFLFRDVPLGWAVGEFAALGWAASGAGRVICGPLGKLTNGLIKICFTEGTLIATENGNKKIEDIKEGDFVWSYNEEKGKKELKKVIALSRNISKSLVKITVNGTEITCTPEHPFYVNGNWTAAKDLAKGTLLTTLDGKTSPVESIEVLNKQVKTYNFEVAENHNYYVSEKGILVHNDCGLPQLFAKIENSIIGGEFKYANGKIVEFLANHNIKGSTLELTEMAFYPKGATANEMANTFGTRQMMETLKTLQNYARENGFTELRIQFQRAANSSSANTGHIFDQLFKL